MTPPHLKPEPRSSRSPHTCLQQQPSNFRRLSRVCSTRSTSPSSSPRACQALLKTTINLRKGIITSPQPAGDMPNHMVSPDLDRLMAMRTYYPSRVPKAEVASWMNCHDRIRHSLRLWSHSLTRDISLTSMKEQAEAVRISS